MEWLGVARMGREQGKADILTAENAKIAKNVAQWSRNREKNIDNRGWRMTRKRL